MTTARICPTAGAPWGVGLGAHYCPDCAAARQYDAAVHVAQPYPPVSIGYSTRGLCDRVGRPYRCAVCDRAAFPFSWWEVDGRDSVYVSRAAAMSSPRTDRRTAMARGLWHFRSDPAGRHSAEYFPLGAGDPDGVWSRVGRDEARTWSPVPA